VDITCVKCQRTFALDDALCAQTKTARCVCGVMIDLQQAALVKRLGKYVLLRRIASGGMGEVFYAKTAGIEGFEREFAIKRMLPHLSADQSFIQMMIKEAKLTVLLNHPNIVQVFDLSKEGDEYYIAMEYVPAINVGQLLKYCGEQNINVPALVAVHIALQSLKGLGYAHKLKDANGQPMHLLHRDVTPQNILVTKQGWVKVTDFGIAKARNEISTTSPGIIRGKVGYIAPEQLSGREPDHRLDLFCVGILLFETLARRRLFKGVDDIDSIRLATEAKVPSLHAIRADVSLELEASINKGLQRDPDDRHQTAEEFYDSLARAVLPHTVDDCAAAASAFLGEHAAAFVPVSAHEAAPAFGMTSALDAKTGETRATNATPITDLTTRTSIPQRSRARMIAVVALLVTLVATGAGAALWRRLAHPIAALPLRPQEVSAVADTVRADILACYKLAGPALRKLEPLSAKLALAASGDVAMVDLSGAESAWGRAGDCVKRVLSKLHFRAHQETSLVTNVDLPPLPAAAVAQSAEPKTAGTTTRSAAAPLSDQEIQATVQRQWGAIARCLKQLDVASAPSRILAALTVAASGKVSDVQLSPPLEPPVAKCLATAIEAMRFRPTPSAFKITLPLTIEKVTQ